VSFIKRTLALFSPSIFLWKLQTSADTIFSNCRA